MGKPKDPFMRQNLHTRLTNEQCCMMVAMRDVLGAKAAESHFQVAGKVQTALSQKVKARPDLDPVYWQYRNSLARRWINQLGETMSACLAKISESISEDEINLMQLRELVRAAEVLGDISVSVTAIAPEALELEAMPKHEIIDVESEEPLMLLGGVDDIS